jgi:hypothetical protein
MQIRILSAADIRRELLRNVKQYNDMRLEHLLKLFYYRQATKEKAGWERSIAYAPMRVSRQKSNNKLPKAEDIYHEAWFVMQDVFSSSEKGLLEKFSEELSDYAPPDHISQNSYKFCEEYHKWMSQYFSSNEMMSMAEARAEISELLMKYQI